MANNNKYLAEKLIFEGQTLLNGALLDCGLQTPAVQRLINTR
jgi:hypothetical protein